MRRHKRLCQNKLETFIARRDQKKRGQVDFLRNTFIREFNNLSLADASAQLGRCATTRTHAPPLGDAPGQSTGPLGKPAPEQRAMLEGLDEAQTKGGGMPVSVSAPIGLGVGQEADMESPDIGKAFEPRASRKGSEQTLKAPIWLKKTQTGMAKTSGFFVDKADTINLQSDPVGDISVQIGRKEPPRTRETGQKKFSLNIQKNNLIHEESIDQSESESLYLKIPKLGQTGAGSARESESESLSQRIKVETQSIRRQPAPTSIINPRALRIQAKRGRRKCNKVFQSMGESQAKALPLTRAVGDGPNAHG